MEQIKHANSLEWHDGIFQKMEIECADAIVVKIFLDLYGGGNERDCVIVEFYDVADIVSSIDGWELSDNRGAGNVSNGYIKKIGRSNRYKFHLYLSDGYINLTFQRLKISDLRI